jgi:hypothetical protein
MAAVSFDGFLTRTAWLEEHETLHGGGLRLGPKSQF